jgi:hypothetical protein
MITLATLFLHLHCSGTLFIATEQFSSTAEILIVDLPLTSEKAVNYNYSYGRGGYQRTVSDKATLLDTNFFVERAPGHFLSDGAGHEASAIELDSSVDFTTFQALALNGQAVITMHTSSEDGFQYLHCRTAE